MGTGSSKNQVTIETLPKPAEPTDDDSSDVVVTKPRRPLARQSTIEKTVTETGAEVGRLRQISVDLSDEASVQNDDELEDIQDLEQTFDSLGIPRTSNSDDSDRSKHNQQNMEKASSEKELSPLRTKLGLPPQEGSPKKDNALEGTPTTLGWGIRSSSGPQARFDSQSNNNNNNSKSAPMKISWSLSQVPSPPDEWNYRKNAMDGFNAERFREVNIKSSRPSTGTHFEKTQEIGKSSNIIRFDGVPDYDDSDQEMLESIENEFKEDVEKKQT